MGSAKRTDKTRQITEVLVTVEVINIVGLKDDGKDLCHHHLVIAVAVSE